MKHRAFLPAAFALAAFPAAAWAQFTDTFNTIDPLVSTELWGHTGTTPGGGACMEFGFTNASPTNALDPADVLPHGNDHHPPPQLAATAPASRGMRTSISVPARRPDLTVTPPPTEAARSCIPSRPSTLFPLRLAA